MSAVSFAVHVRSGGEGRRLARGAAPCSCGRKLGGRGREASLKSLTCKHVTVEVMATKKDEDAFGGRREGGM